MSTNLDRVAAAIAEVHPAARIEPRTLGDRTPAVQAYRADDETEWLVFDSPADSVRPFHGTPGVHIWPPRVRGAVYAKACEVAGVDPCEKCC